MGSGESSFKTFSSIGGRTTSVEDVIEARVEVAGGGGARETSAAGKEMESSICCGG